GPGRGGRGGGPAVGPRPAAAGPARRRGGPGRPGRRAHRGRRGLRRPGLPRRRHARPPGPAGRGDQRPGPGRHPGGGHGDQPRAGVRGRAADPGAIPFHMCARGHRRGGHAGAGGQGRTGARRRERGAVRVMPARRAGAAGLLVEAEGTAPRLAAAIDADRILNLVDVIPGARTVLVVTEPGLVALDELAARIEALPLPPAGPAAAREAEIPVVYDGPDLAEVARLTGLSPGEVIARHAAAEYTVGWMGFSPGFGYLTGTDRGRAAVPRLDEPRLRVPAGSVAVAGGLAAVYPTTSPGGWRLLGRTSAVLWDPDRDPPALFAPGMRVRFRPACPGDAPG